MFYDLTGMSMPDFVIAIKVVPESLLHKPLLIVNLNKFTWPNSYVQLHAFVSLLHQTVKFYEQYISSVGLT